MKKMSNWKKLVVMFLVMAMFVGITAESVQAASWKSSISTNFKKKKPGMTTYLVFKTKKACTVTVTTTSAYASAMYAGNLYKTKDYSNVVYDKSTKTKKGKYVQVFDLEAGTYTLFRDIEAKGYKVKMSTSGKNLMLVKAKSVKAKDSIG